MAQFYSTEDNEVKVWDKPISAEEIDEVVNTILNETAETTSLVIYLQHGPKPYAAKIAVQVGEGVNSQNIELARFSKAKDAITTFANYAVKCGTSLDLTDADGTTFKSILI